MKEAFHKPVLLREVMELLDPKENDVVVDATFGFGGHSAEILKKIGERGKLIGVEQDSDIYEISKNHFSDRRLHLINKNFTELPAILKGLKIKKVDKILFDLGISSYHYDELGAGFSFKDEYLDMRLDRSQGESAEDLVNYLSEQDLANLIYRNADEYRSRRIAKAIVTERKKKRISSARELSELIERTVPRSGRTHSATKTFQALRIAVNNEIENLESILPQTIDLLNKNGRVVIISFHSIEDRIVKNIFKNLKTRGKIIILTKKPIVSTREENIQNPRSRSAKLRAALKV